MNVKETEKTHTISSIDFLQNSLFSSTAFLRASISPESNASLQMNLTRIGVVANKTSPNQKILTGA